MYDKVELPYFNIEGSYGGNQKWMLDGWMHIGGCAALTTCDFLIYCALYKNMKELYPYYLEHLSRRDYRKFGMSMKPYLRPRDSGIKDIETYIEGVKIYLEDINVNNIEIEGLKGHCPYEEARDGIASSIDRGMPVSYLMLRHKDKKFDFFKWHWFIVIGYEQREDGFYIKVATYGDAYWLNLEELWDTGYDEKGGLVFFDIK